MSDHLLSNAPWDINGATQDEAMALAMRDRTHVRNYGGEVPQTQPENAGDGNLASLAMQLRERLTGTSDGESA